MSALTEALESLVAARRVYLQVQDAGRDSRPEGYVPADDLTERQVLDGIRDDHRLWDVALMYGIAGEEIAFEGRLQAPLNAGVLSEWVAAAIVGDDGSWLLVRLDGATRARLYRLFGPGERVRLDARWHQEPATPWDVPQRPPERLATFAEIPAPGHASAEGMPRVVRLCHTRAEAIRRLSPPHRWP